MQEIHRIKAVFPAQIHQMLEVPADQRTDSGQSASGGMKRVVAKFRRNDLVGKVCVCE